jgi:hypothetical protein
MGSILKPEALTLRLWNMASENKVQPLNLMTGRPIWRMKNPAISTILYVSLGSNWREDPKSRGRDEKIQGDGNGRDDGTGTHMNTTSTNTRNQV